jgi:hypothetical protein
MTNPKESGARIEVGPYNMIIAAMEDLPEAERGGRSRRNSRRRWPRRGGGSSCVSKKQARVIKKTVLAITTTATTTSMVTPNLTPEELVKFMDVAVASKYENDLKNFTRTITKEVHSILDTFKTDLQNTLLWQIRSVV